MRAKHKKLKTFNWSIKSVTLKMQSNCFLLYNRLIINMNVPKLKLYKFLFIIYFINFNHNKLYIRSYQIPPDVCIQIHIEEIILCNKIINMITIIFMNLHIYSYIHRVHCLPIRYHKAAYSHDVVILSNFL